MVVKIQIRLSTWDSFGEQLAESSRDTWQIEMYGD